MGEAQGYTMNTKDNSEPSNQLVTSFDKKHVFSFTISRFIEGESYFGETSRRGHFRGR